MHNLLKLHKKLSKFIMRLFGFVNNIFPKNDKEKMTENMLKLLNTAKIASSQNRNITRKTELFGQRSLPNYFNSLTKKRN